VKTVPLALWIPCTLSALALHVLLAGLMECPAAGSARPSPPREPDFVLNARSARRLGEEPGLALPASWWRPYSARLAASVLPELEREILELGRAPSWAGHYAQGEGERLSLAPRRGFWFERPLWCASGRVAVEGGALLLESSGRDERFVSVRWGRRQYLIEDYAWPEFVSAVSRGEEPRSKPQGRFLLRVGDEHAPVVGWPKIVGASR
jgi:hypothetical protein